MRTPRSASLVLALMVMLGGGVLLAQQRGRTVPARRIAAPDTVSPAMRAVIERPLSP